MKIALVGPDPLFKGGIGQYNHFLALEALRQGHEILFVGFRRQYPAFLYPPGTGDVTGTPSGASQQIPHPDLLLGKGEGEQGIALSFSKERAAKPGEVSYPVERILSWTRPFSWRTAARRIEAFAPDVVAVPWWTFFWYPWFAPLLDRLRRFPRVVIAHNAADHEKGGLRGTLSRWASARILRRADRVIVQSESEKRQAEAMGARRTVVVHHPVYPQFSSTISRAEARRRLGIAPDAKVALLFGALRPYKGADLFADAVASLPHVTGIVAGEIWDKELGARLRQRAAAAPNLRLLDRYFDDEEGALLFAACDAAVLPYRAVTGSGAAMAALGAGRPLVVSDLPLFRELFDPPLATFFAAGDARDLARALDRFFAGESNNILLSEAAPSMIFARFGWDRPVAAVAEAAEKG